MSRFHILVWGAVDEPAVVCVHRERAHARRFERLGRMMTASRRVIAYDLRGHGRSPWSGPHSIAQHAADLDEVLDVVGAEHVAIVADGYGGRIALEYAAGHGERVTALALVDPPLAPAPAPLLAMADAEREGYAYVNVDEALEHWPGFAGLEHTPRALLEEEVAEHLVSGPDGLFRFRYSGDAAAAALEEMAEPAAGLKEIGCPVLLVRASRSDLLLEQDMQQAAAELRRCRLASVPGGCVPLFDALAETGALVRDFMAAPARA